MELGSGGRDNEQKVTTRAFETWTNRHNKQFIYGIIIIAVVEFSFFSVIAVILGVYGGHFSYGKYVSFSIAILITSLLLLALLLKEFILRPRTIEIQPNGILLISQWGRRRFVPWNWIKSISLSATTERWNQESYREAKIFTAESTFWVMTYREIAESIIDAHKEATGYDIKISTY